MPTAVVINPWVTDIKLYDEWMHPLGLYFAISLLRRSGWKVAYVNCLMRDGKAPAKRYGTGDFPATEIEKPPLYASIPRRYKRYGITPQELDERMASLPRPDLVLVGTGMTYWIEGLRGTVEAVRRRWESAPLLLGGIAATLIPGYLRAALPGVHVVPGPLRSAGAEIERLYGRPGSLDATGWTPDLRDALSLVPVLYHAPLLMSLGCPMRCGYCASNILQPRLEHRSHETVMDEARFAVEERGVRDLSFYDDALLHRADQHFLPLLRDLTRLGGEHIRLHAPNGMHVRWIDRPVADAMKAAGFVTVRLGYESGAAEHARNTGAKADLSGLRRAVDALLLAGFRRRDIGVYLMGGLPGQSPEELIAELDAVGSLGVRPKPVFLSPVPRTALFEQYARRFPQLREDPLWHNDAFFVTQLPGWGWRAMEEVGRKARLMNDG